MANSSHTLQIDILRWVKEFSIGNKIVTVRFAEAGEMKKIQLFIDSYWKSGHVLSTSDQVFSFQHCDLYRDRLNYVVSEDDEGSFNGILGFIDTLMYSDDDSVGNVIWYTTWKVLDNGPPLLGLKMKDFLNKQFSSRSFGTVGLNSKTKHIYDRLGYKTGVLDHYYILNPNIKDSRVGSSLLPSDVIPSSNMLIRLNSVSQIEELIYDSLYSSDHAYKNAAYFSRRYLEHPILDYSVLALVSRDGGLLNILVGREEMLNESAVFRIVDLWSSFNVSGLGKSLMDLIVGSDYEYVDLMAYMPSKDALLEEGFRKVEGNTIVPNYFHPFVKRNINVYYAVKSDSCGIFRGDCDQDRPS